MHNSGKKNLVLRACSAIARYSLILLFPLLAMAVPGTESNECPGWKIAKLTQAAAVAETCIATWTSGGPAELSIIAEGPLLSLAVSSPTFSREKHEELIGLKKPGTVQLQRQARVADSIYGITIDNEVDSCLEKDGPLVLTVKGVDYSFTVANASSAIDAVRRCVGQPTKAEMQRKNASPFTVPDGWEALDNVGGCAARLKGDEVDTWVSINNSDQVLLIAGRPDWNSWGQEVKLTLQIDSQAPRSFTASKWNNLVLLLLFDDKDVAALRKASSLRWHLPSGDYYAKVHDVGSALDAAALYTRKKRVGESR